MTTRERVAPRSFCTRLLTGVIIALCSNAAVGEPGNDASLLADFTIRQWGLESGLPERAVQAVSQTDDGYLWVATFRRLLRFDGVRFVDVGSPGSTFDATPSEIIRCVQPGPPGEIYVLTTERLWRYDRGAWQVVMSASLNADPAEWQAAMLRADTAGGVYLSSHDGARLVSGPPVAFGGQAPDACPVWLRLGHNPAERTGGGFTVRPLPAHDPVLEMATDHDDPLALSRQGVFGRSDGGWRRLADRPDGMRLVEKGRDGSIWCGGERGIGRFHDRKWRFVTAGSTPFNVGIRCLFVDSVGDVWAGTDGGLLHIRHRAVGVEVVPAPGRLPGIKAAWVGTDEAVHAIPESGGVMRLTNARADAHLEPVPFASPPGQMLFSAVAVDAAGEYWLGTDGGYLWRGRSGAALSRLEYAREGRRMASIFSLAGDATTTLWIGSGDGVFTFRDARLAPVADSNSNVHPINSIFIDRDRSVWIGRIDEWLDHRTEEGTILRRYVQDVPRSSIHCFHRDRDGSLWAGGDGQLLELTAAADDGPRLWEPADGVPRSGIMQLAEAADGRLWAGTQEGIFMLEPTSPAGTGPRFRARRLDAAGPLARVACTGRINRSRVGDMILFPTTAGLVRVDPAAVPWPTSDLAVVIEEVGVNNARVSPEVMCRGPIAVPPAPERVDVTFTAPFPSSPEAVGFRYRLTEATRPVSDGIDWIEIGDQRRIRLSGLAAGSHRLDLQAGIDGRFGPATASVELVVATAFWRRTDLLISVAVLGATAVVGWSSMLLRSHYRRRLAAAVALQRERERIARDLHDDLGAGLTQVAHLSAMAADHAGEQGDEQAFRRIFQTTSRLTAALDQIVWSVNPANDSLDKLISYVAEYAQEFCGSAGVHCRLALPAEDDACHVPAAVRHHVCMVLKESLNNAVRHGRTREISVTIETSLRTFSMRIHDDGSGFDVERMAADGPSWHHCGLGDMRHRAEEIGGRLTLASQPGHGTTVHLAVTFDRGSGCDRRRRPGRT